MATIDKIWDLITLIKTKIEAIKVGSDYIFKSHVTTDPTQESWKKGFYPNIIITLGNGQDNLVAQSNVTNQIQTIDITIFVNRGKYEEAINDILDYHKLIRIAINMNNDFFYQDEENGIEGLLEFRLTDFSDIGILPREYVRSGIGAARTLTFQATLEDWCE